jgi:RNA polymerase sigma-70 factor (sigma-E family)
VNREDEDEFRDFVSARFGSLRKLAYMACGDWHIAEDAVANAMAKLYPRWGRLEQPDRYVQTMVFRAAVDETRRPWRRERSASHALPDVVQRDPSDATDERMRVLAALRAVPPRQRAALVLRFYQGLSVEETALVLDCRTGTVKSQTLRGLNRLRELLAAEHISLTNVTDVEESEQNHAGARRAGIGDRTSAATSPQR